MAESWYKEWSIARAYVKQCKSNDSENIGHRIGSEKPHRLSPKLNANIPL